MSQHKSDTINLSQLTFSLQLELGINNNLQKYLDAREVYNDFSSTMSALYLIGILPSDILYQICFLSTLVWLLQRIEVVKKYFLSTFLIVQHILMVWRTEHW